MTMYKDYDADKIAAKLKQVLEFEAKYGENDTSRGWKKWCLCRSSTLSTS